jgi:aminomethyltransferase
MVSFGGWEMPVEYSGILSEHMAVRTKAGLFDVSHMGEIEVRGPEALALVQSVTCNDASKLAVGQAQYSGLMTSKGTFVDDVLVHKMTDDHYFLCVNASNREKDFEWIKEHNCFDATVANTSDDYTQLALQGPKAFNILQRLTSVSLEAIRYYRFTFGKVAGVDAMIARTGYTGEDGFEIYFHPAHSEELWTRLLETGKPEGLVPVGLGARNTLRLEASYCLYGNDIDESTTVFEANLGWICKLEKGEFLGRALLIGQQKRGVERLLVGIEVLDRAIAREHYSIYHGGTLIGQVTSGSFAPFLKKNIGLGYLPVTLARPGTNLSIAIRNTHAAARVVETPFYRRSR